MTLDVTTPSILDPEPIKKLDPCIALDVQQNIALDDQIILSIGLALLLSWWGFTDNPWNHILAITVLRRRLGTPLKSIEIRNSGEQGLICFQSKSNTKMTRHNPSQINLTYFADNYKLDIFKIWQSKPKPETFLLPVIVFT